MRLVYSTSRFQQADVVHRFDVLGELLPNDLDILKNSLQFFFNQLKKSGTICPVAGPRMCPVVVLDFSESSIKVSEAQLQVFVGEVKTRALAEQVFLSVAQSDIESMHAEQKAIEQSLLTRLNLLENRLNLVESTKKKIAALTVENAELRDELKDAVPKKTARNFFENLWGES